MLSIIEEYQQYYRTVSSKFDTWVPELREKIKYSKKTRVYGVELARHIRYSEILDITIPSSPKNRESPVYTLCIVICI